MDWSLSRDGNIRLADAGVRRLGNHSTAERADCAAAVHEKMDRHGIGVVGDIRCGDAVH